MARVNGITQFYLPLTKVYLHVERAIITLLPSHSTSPHFVRYSLTVRRRPEKLSWPKGD